MATSEQRSKSTHTEKTPRRGMAQASISPNVKAPRANSRRAVAAERAAAKSGLPSKQETVIGMLRQPNGTTVAAVVEATGWQQHSVRGFFAAVIKKKLKLKLTSAKAGKERIYRIAKAGASA